MTVSGSGTASSVATYYPFGEEGVSIVAQYKFTSQMRDLNVIDHFWHRKYAGNIARWLSPDPTGASAVDVQNPQSLDLYSYAGNDPLANIDPFGTKGNKYACFFTEHQFSLAVTVAGFMLDYSPVGWGLHALDVGMIAYHHFYC